MKLIDMHCDTILEMMKESKIHFQNNHLCIDLEKLLAAGSMAQFFAHFIDLGEFHGKDDAAGDGYQKALRMIAYTKQALAPYKEQILPATAYKEVIDNEQKGIISAILCIEEGGILDNQVERLEELYRQGIRLLTLTWNYENCLGYPNSRDSNLMKLGLKPFGIEVIERMNQLGMIIDVSHLSDGGFWDVCRYSQKPFVASHSNARALCDHPRNLTDEMIRAIAQKGGVIGVNFYPYFLRADGKACEEDIADHIEYLYQVGGEDVLGIGTDFDGFSDGMLQIRHIGEIERVYEAIKNRGFTERVMDKLCFKNILRVMMQ